MVDVWHIDYVRLAANEDGEAIFEDIAFTRPPNSILRKYSSMPWSHFDGFESQELNDELAIQLI